MIPVAEARALVLKGLVPLPAETVSLTQAWGRVLAARVSARVSSPHSDISAMDGYAVRAADVATVPAQLRQIAEVPAGSRFDGTVGPGDCVRIFTGAPLPAGTDTIVIQEDTSTEGATVTVHETAVTGRYVRPKGMDFGAGAVLLTEGRVLTARDIALAAAMNVPWLTVRRHPRIAILATGDEIALPGEPIGPSHLPSANAPGLAALVTAWGGQPVILPAAGDRIDALRAAAAQAVGCDLLVTTGGASVGKHDLVRDAFAAEGLDLAFWKIAMRPGKPLMRGQIGALPLLGLPGNPVSTMVCGVLFLRPMIRALLGLTVADDEQSLAVLGKDLPRNDRREDYMRARLHRDQNGALIATPFDRQDSSMIATLAAADCLVVRAPHAEAIQAGATVPIVHLGLDRIPT